MSESAPLGPPLPADETVLRLSFRSSDGKISPEAFELSSADKRQVPPRLSVFAASRTTPEQAWEIVNRNPRFVAAARLGVSAVRSITPLDVRWDPIANPLPGAGGHAALTGLAEGTKLERKIMRVRLADLANHNTVTDLGPQMTLE